MRLVVILFFIFVSLSIQAQRTSITFYNDSAKKFVQIRSGEMLLVKYSGYLKQVEIKADYLLNLNDSTLTLGQTSLFRKSINSREININDITGFRKISAGTQLLKLAFTISATLGSFYAINENKNLNSTQKLLFSTAAGFAINFSVKWAFPFKKEKYKMKNGWKIMVR